MTRGLLAFCFALLVSPSGPAVSQSTLEQYLKKSGQSANATEVQSDLSGSNVVFEDKDGHWRLDDSRSTGGFCAVTYYSAPNFAGYVGPAAGNPDAFILFSGPTIPAIRREKKKKMSLRTGDGNVQSVLAFHAPNTQSKDSGMILFRLTDIQAAISDMNDVEDLSVTIDRKQVFAINWKGGLKARASMQSCLQDELAKP